MKGSVYAWYAVDVWSCHLSKELAYNLLFGALTKKACFWKFSANPQLRVDIVNWGCWLFRLQRFAEGSVEHWTRRRGSTRRAKLIDDETCQFAWLQGSHRWVCERWRMPGRSSFRTCSCRNLSWMQMQWTIGWWRRSSASPSGHWYRRVPCRSSACDPRDARWCIPEVGQRFVWRCISAR